MTIPEDIRRKSIEVFHKLAARAEATKKSGEAFWSSESTPEIIAEALMAERERSAQAARDYLASEYMPDFGSLPDDLAEAILRSPDKAGTPHG